MEQEVPPKEKLWIKKNAFLLFSIGYANLLLGTCYSLPAPFFPPEAERKGASPTVYGLIFGAFQLTNLIMSPTWGKLMPHLVPRFVLIAGMFVAGSSSVLYGLLEFSPPGNPYIILSFLVRIVQSIGICAYITTCYGMLPILFPSNYATVLSTVETLFGFGMMAGPTIGGAFYQIGGYYLPFVVMGGLLMVGTLLTSVSLSGKDDSIQDKTGSVVKIMASPGIIIDGFIICFSMLWIGFNDATLEPHLRSFQLQPAVVGSVFIITEGVYAFVSPFYGYMMDKGVNPHLICLFGSVACLVSYVIIGPLPFLPFEKSLWIIIVALVLQGFAFGALFFCPFVHGTKDLRRRNLPDNVSTYAMYTGIMMGFSALGAFVGPSVGGLLLEHVGYANGTAVIVGLQILLIVLLLPYLIVTRSRRDKGTSQVTQRDGPVSKEEQETSPLLKKTQNDLTSIK